MEIRDIALIALISAIATAGKLALAFIPNVEIITLLFILYTTTLGLKRSLPAALVFTTTEVLLFGFGTWLLGYYIIWPLLILLTAILDKKTDKEIFFALLAAVFGFASGLIFALVESLFYGYVFGFSYWLRGLPFDVVRGVSNFIIVLLLFKPLKETLKTNYIKYLA